MKSLIWASTWAQRRLQPKFWGVSGWRLMFCVICKNRENIKKVFSNQKKIQTMWKVWCMEFQIFNLLKRVKFHKCAVIIFGKKNWGHVDVWNTQCQVQQDINLSKSFFVWNFNICWEQNQREHHFPSKLWLLENLGKILENFQLKYKIGSRLRLSGEAFQ